MKGGHLSLPGLAALFRISHVLHWRAAEMKAGRSHLLPRDAGRARTNAVGQRERSLSPDRPLSKGPRRYRSRTPDAPGRTAEISCPPEVPPPPESCPTQGVPSSVAEVLIRMHGAPTNHSTRPFWTTMASTLMVGLFNKARCDKLNELVEKSLSRLGDDEVMRIGQFGRWVASTKDLDNYLGLEERSRVCNENDEYLFDDIELAFISLNTPSSG